MTYSTIGSPANSIPIEQQWADLYKGAGLVPVPLIGKSPAVGGADWQGEARRRIADTARFKGHNIGLLFGNEWADVDCDCREAAHVAALYLPRTARFGRPTHPQSHYIYRCKDAKSLKLTAPGQTIIELRCGEVQTVAPPSTRYLDPKKLGQPTEPLQPEAISWDPGPIAFATIDPTELDRLVRIIAAAAALRRVWPLPGGGGHTCDLALTGALLTAGWPDYEAERFCDAVGVHASQIGTTRDRVERGENVIGWGKLREHLGADLIAKVKEWLGIQPALHTLTDDGNALRFVDQHGESVRFVPRVGWHVFDGRRWLRDDAGARIELARETVRAIYTSEVSEASKRAGLISRSQEDLDRPKKLLAHAAASKSKSRIEAMISLAQSDPSVVARVESLDSDPMLFNVGNGSIDLKSGLLKPHDRTDLVTRLSPVHFDASATCPTWDRFLERVLPSLEVRAFVQRYIGYSLTGDVGEQVLLFAHGDGSNGKSTFIGTVLELFGEYGRTAPPRLLVARRSEQHPTELARLLGARLVASVETAEGQSWDEERVKGLTGGDRISARHMREDFFDFSPTHKIFLAANHKPIIRGQDYAIWRRIRLVPFTATIPEGEKDPALPAKLRAELPGILRWAIAGCLAWQQTGLGTPPAVSEATASYRTENDVLGSFLADECTLDPSATVEASTLYGRYQSWTDQMGEKAVTQKVFGRDLTARGFSRKRNAAGRYVYPGLALSR